MRDSLPWTSPEIRTSFAHGYGGHFAVLRSLRQFPGWCREKQRFFRPGIVVDPSLRPILRQQRRDNGKSISRVVRPVIKANHRTRKGGRESGCLERGDCESDLKCDRLVVSARRATPIAVRFGPVR